MSDGHEATLPPAIPAIEQTGSQLFVGRATTSNPFKIETAKPGISMIFQT